MNEISKIRLLNAGAQDFLDRRHRLEFDSEEAKMWYGLGYSLAHTVLNQLEAKRRDNKDYDPAGWENEHILADMRQRTRDANDEERERIYY